MIFLSAHQFSLSALVKAIGQQGPSAEDNPLLAAGVYSKEVTCDNHPQIPDTSWAERAHVQCPWAFCHTLYQTSNSARSSQMHW